MNTLAKYSHRDVYKAAGVDTAGADEGLSLLTRNILSTWPKKGEVGGVQLDIGYFANVVALGDLGIGICTDGIGSKAIIAQMVDKYDTVGIDCVAMNVNDLICVGARPLSMVDYIAVEVANPRLLEQLSIGLTEGARQAGISISGGEISQIKDIIKGVRPGFGFDLVGMAVGDVAIKDVNVGEDIADGDVVIGIESNGIHSNGLSLARSTFFEKARFGVDQRLPGLELPLGLELLKPTFIYVPEVMAVLRQVPTVKSLAHITSDGLINLTRVKAKVGYEIDNLPRVPPIFSLIQSYGEVEDAEMYEVYNMGVGFCVVVGAADADRTLDIIRSFGRRAQRIGHTIADAEKGVYLNKERLKGYPAPNKGFVRA